MTRFNVHCESLGMLTQQTAPEVPRVGDKIELHLDDDPWIVDVVVESRRWAPIPDGSLLCNVYTAHHRTVA